MAVYKCKMCGGSLEVKPGQSIVKCEYCDTMQTVPTLDNERKENLYGRANHFFRNNDYDKAMDMYEDILSEDADDADVYWSIVLCRYGVEYVEDSETHRMVPTINRTQFTSIYDDDNYKLAIKHSNEIQRAVYEVQAKQINDIQKGILEISQKEDPFDVFICFKEDENGNRTLDSVLANDLYYRLEQEGFKVFFSRITLEDKIGSAYEPYIFAALNSAKVMVVMGTKPEYFSSVWVRNEWSRYLTLVKRSQGRKVLIPAYKDMDPYDLPNEFAHLQALDMGKLGFMQDLIRGVKKIIERAEPQENVKETIVVNQMPVGEIEPLLKRAFLFLEDREWDRADDYSEQVLNQDPENAQAYLVKLMAELRCSKKELLREEAKPFNHNKNYSKIIRFGDDEIKTELRSYISEIMQRNEQNRLNSIYMDATLKKHSAENKDDFLEAARIYERILQFKDAEQEAKECRILAENAGKDAVLKEAGERFKKIANLKWLTVSRSKYEEGISKLEEVLEKFRSVAGWKDADEKAEDCENTINILREEWREYERKEEERRIQRKTEAEKEAAEYERKRKRNIKTAAACIGIAIAALFLIFRVIIPNKDYNEAVGLYNAGDYEKAGKIFKGIDGFKDAREYLKKCIQEPLKSASVGETVEFGKYDQNTESGSGKDPIKWIVLDKTDDAVLLLSETALDVLPYDDGVENAIWEKCSLRKWLNGIFFEEAFSKNESEIIMETELKNEDNPTYGTEGGNDTCDKVFLLSIDDAEKYFTENIDRICKASEKAAEKKLEYCTDRRVVNWLLRSPGKFKGTVSSVSMAGQIEEKGELAFLRYLFVRPAIWVSTE